MLADDLDDADKGKMSQSKHQCHLLNQPTSAIK